MQGKRPAHTITQPVWIHFVKWGGEKKNKKENESTQGGLETKARELQSL